jgi:tetraacyldisaccharide 4'-kinase
MVDKWILRILLSPLALLFGIGVLIKSLIYKSGLLKGVSFSIPVINVGNLTVGGAGKTPHVEYLIRLLSPYLPVGTLSRGYKRKTKGFMLIRPGFNSDQAGDEPLLYARKYPGIAVSVCESRSIGVPKLLQSRPQTRVVLLDDAFQHRAINPNLNILLTEYDEPFYKDWLLPAGRLREWRAGYKRADLIIVTKCPLDMKTEERDEMRRKINPVRDQHVFFSRYGYFTPYRMWDAKLRTEITEEHEVLLICGIAKTEYLLDYLHTKAGAVKLIQFEDHHVYTRHDMEMIKKYYDNMIGDRRMVLTTEKDAMRLEGYREFFTQNDIQIDILPIQVSFLFDDGPKFDDWIQRFLLNFTV